MNFLGLCPLVMGRDELICALEGLEPELINDQWWEDAYWITWRLTPLGTWDNAAELNIPDWQHSSVLSHIIADWLSVMGSTDAWLGLCCTLTHLPFPLLNSAYTPWLLSGQQQTSEFCRSFQQITELQGELGGPSRRVSVCVPSGRTHVEETGFIYEKNNSTSSHSTQ